MSVSHQQLQRDKWAAMCEDGWSNKVRNVLLLLALTSNVTLQWVGTNSFGKRAHISVRLQIVNLLYPVVLDIYHLLAAKVVPRVCLTVRELTTRPVSRQHCAAPTGIAIFVAHVFVYFSLLQNVIIAFWCHLWPWRGTPWLAKTCQIRTTDSGKSMVWFRAVHGSDLVNPFK